MARINQYTDAFRAGPRTCDHARDQASYACFAPVLRAGNEHRPIYKFAHLNSMNDPVGEFFATKSNYVLVRFIAAKKLAYDLWRNILSQPPAQGLACISKSSDKPICK